MEITKTVVRNLKRVRDYARKCPLGHWSFLAPGEEDNGTERTITNLNDSGISLQISRLPISKKADIQSSGPLVRWIGDS